MSIKCDFKLIDHIYAWLGMTSLKPHLQINSPFYASLSFIPILVQFLIVSIETYIFLTYSDQFLHQTSNLAALTDGTETFGLIMVGYVQIAENIWKSEIGQNINESIKAFDQEIFAGHFCQKNCSFCQRLTLWPFLFRRIVYIFLIALLNEIAIILTIADVDKRWRQSIIVRETTAIMIRVGLIYIVCHFYWVVIINNSIFHILSLFPVKSRSELVFNLYKKGYIIQYKKCKDIQTAETHTN